MEAALQVAMPLQRSGSDNSRQRPLAVDDVTELLSGCRRSLVLQMLLHLYILLQAGNHLCQPCRVP